MVFVCTWEGMKLHYTGGKKARKTVTNKVTPWLDNEIGGQKLIESSPDFFFRGGVGWGGGVLVIQPRISHMLSKCFTTELYLSSSTAQVLELESLGQFIPDVVTAVSPWAG
jgi:hypothetical protein